MGITVEIRFNRFPEGAALMKHAVGAAFASEKTVMLSDMQQRTPVATGELRGSESAENTDTTLTLRATAEHAIYVHQGTRHMGARPFMVQAVEAGVPRLAEAIVREATGTLGG